MSYYFMKPWKTIRNLYNTQLRPWLKNSNFEWCVRKLFLSSVTGSSSWWSPTGFQFGLLQSYIFPYGNLISKTFSRIDIFWPQNKLYSGWWRIMVVVADGTQVAHLDVVKYINFENFSKTTQYFFLIVSGPNPHRIVLKTTFGIF